MDERNAAVVAKARDGDREAFRALVDRHSRYLFSLAHRMTGNAQDAEDVVQESRNRGQGAAGARDAKEGQGQGRSETKGQEARYLKTSARNRSV